MLVISTALFATDKGVLAKTSWALFQKHFLHIKWCTTYVLTWLIKFLTLQKCLLTLMPVGLCSHCISWPQTSTSVCIINRNTLHVLCFLKTMYYGWLLYGSVSQGLGTTKFTNLIGWNGYWPRSRFFHLDRHLDR